MKNIILTFTLLCSLPVLSSSTLVEETLVIEDEPSIKRPSKAERFQKKFPEVEKAQLEKIFGMVATIFGPMQSDLEHVTLPALEKQILEEEDADTRILLECKREAKRLKMNNYAKLVNTFSNLPQIYSYILSQIEGKNYFSFSNSMTDSSGKSRASFSLCHDDSVALRAKGEEWALQLSHFYSNRAWKVTRNYRLATAKNYKASQALALFLTDLEPSADLTKKTRRFFVQKLEDKLEKQEFYRALFDLLEEYFLIPLERFQEISKDSSILSDEDFDKKLAELS